MARYLILNDDGIIYDGTEDDMREVYNSINSENNTDWDVDWKGEILLAKVTETTRRK